MEAIAAEAPQLLAAEAASSGLAIDTSRREAVRNYYNALFYASEDVEMGWTGSVSGCLAGTAAAPYREAELLRINLMRALAGVPAAVTLNAEFSAKAQQAALMMSADDSLSHTPKATAAARGSAWPCLSDAGDEAAGQSNLSLGSAGPDAITFGQIKDPGANNAAVGHRRWLLYPQTQEMGVGDVAGDGTNAHPPANAVWVFDSHFRDPRPATRDNFVAWPPPGYLPHTLIFPRWSFSYPGADFGAARISMARNGQAVPLRLEPFVSNVGDNTLVWLPSDPGLTDPAPAPSVDASYAVHIEGVKLNGQTIGPFDYAVTVFDPFREGTDTIISALTGPDGLGAGQAATYTVATGDIPAADGQEAIRAPIRAESAIRDAEAGQGDFLADASAGYSVVSGDMAASGSRSFHLMDARSKRQSLTLSPRLVPGAAAKLSFQSRLTLATADETAAVQISLDDGHTWRNLDTQSGNGKGFPIQSGFESWVLPLDAWAGRVLRIRFSFDIADRSGFSFYAPGTGVGWYFDDVAFQDVKVLDSPAISAVAGNQIAFQMTDSTPQALAVRGTVRGQPLAWGQVKTVRPAAGAGNQAPVANAGADRTAVLGAEVILNGSASFDPDDGPAGLGYSWTQESGPAAVLTGADRAVSSFIPQLPGTYMFTLKVSDGASASPADSVAIIIREPDPLAVAFPNGGEVLKVRQRVLVTWNSSRLPAKAKLKLFVLKNGSRWVRIGTPKNKGSFRWKIAKSQAGEAVRIRLCGPSSLPAAVRCDESDGAFRIER